jgi:sulfur carrier protein ThiS
MPVDAKQWLADLLKEAGVEDEGARTAIEKLAANEKVAKKVAVEVGLQSEFNRRMGELDKQQEASKQYWQDLDAWGKGKKAEFDKAVRTASHATARTAAYAAYLQSNGFDPEQVATGLPVAPGTGTVVKTEEGQWVSKAQYEKDLQTYAANVGTTMKDIGVLTGQHMHRFGGEPLDWDAFEEFMRKGNYTAPRAAYKDWIEPRVKEMEQTTRKAEIDAARAEGYAAAASKAGMPTDTNAPGPTPGMFFTRPAETGLPPNATEWERDQYFAREFERDALSAASPPKP